MTIASVGVQRVGPPRMVTGEGFCPGPDPCEIPALGGGFPAAWLVDNPQISVPNALAVPEDDVRWGAFALDVAFWLALGWGAVTFAPWKGRERRERGAGTKHPD